MSEKKVPVVHFGAVKEKPIDWRAVPDDPDPDDEELFVSPPEIVGVLGFDPQDMNQ